MPSDRHEYSEDLFADTRMSFGEHIEELRTHLLRAIKGLVFCLLIGFFLDAVGYFLGWDHFGIGKPMMEVIKAPVRQALIDFYDRRLAKLEEDARNKDKAAEEATKPQPIRITLDEKALALLRGQPVPAESGPVTVEVMMSPLDVYKAHKSVMNVVRPPELSTLTITESFMVYFKVSLICGFVMASPWVFYQLWSFVAAGLYPHEKTLVHYYMPVSIALFLFGVVACQIFVMPRSIEALLWFNEWLNITPELRLTDWLSFAIMLPVVFGLSFQTPIVMLLLEQIGIMTVERYIAGWRIAVFVLAILAAVITPTPDAFNWFLMWAPMIGLYVLGIWLCKIAAKRRGPQFEVPETDELIEA
ncbi:MAG: twin-arginine translocase subunit TatC [Gemmataceae bacterium]